MWQKLCSIGRILGWNNGLGFGLGFDFFTLYMSTIKSFTELDVWKIGMELVKEVYAITRHFPYDERFGLTSQIQRAATGILANTAEGFSRQGSADKAYKYTIARGECSEVKALLLISIELQFIAQDRITHAVFLTEKVGQLLSGLQRSYTPNPNPNPNPKSPHLEP